MKNLLIILAIAAGLGVATFSWYQSGYNKIVSLDQQVKSSWAQVENQLQRRFDLIPNLVNVVKGYTNHEKEVLEKVTRLRSQWSQAATLSEKVQVSNELSNSLSRLMVVIENYPNLKADQHFLALQSQLEGTENRIAVERMRYNEAVQAFNSYQKSLFGGFFAARTGLNNEAIYFKTELQVQEVPKVNF